MNTDIWNEICDLLSESLPTDINERRFQEFVVQALRLLEWRKSLGDIECQRPIPTGSASRMEPDIIVKSNYKDLFVIELKLPNTPIISRNQQQLFSYMRQLKLEYGMLIGQGIHIFYEGPLSNQNDPILVESIKFERNNPKGEKFVDLFCKDSFNQEALKEYTLEAINIHNRKKQMKVLYERILSNDFRRTIPNLIKQEFINEFDGELIDSVLEGLEIEIREKDLNPTSTLITDNETKTFARSQNTFKTTFTGSSSSLNTEKRTVDGKKIGQFVQDSFRISYEKGLISANEIKNLQNKTYCKTEFGQSIEVLRHSSKGTRDETGHNRFYAKEIFCGGYWLNSQWNESHWEKFLSWLRKIQK